MKNSLFALFLACITFSAFSQSYVEMMQDPDANFYDIQAAFNEEWQDKEVTKGSGWKQFKRWENFVEPRVYPHGNQIQSMAFYQTWKDARRNVSFEAKDNTAWEPYGPTAWTHQNGWNPGLGRVNVTVKHPTEENTIFVGTPAGGLWKSEDAGQSWIPMTDNLPAIGVSGLAIDPTNTDIMYIATGDGDAGDTYSLGVLKSEDAGETWQPTGLAHDISSGVTCSKILMDPNDNQRLWVATTSGLYYTTDGGTTWTQSITQWVKDIEIHPTNTNIIYASGSRFFKSEDGGENFDLITDGTPPNSAVYRVAISVTAANPDYLYLLACDNNEYGFYGLYRSDDAGDSFTQMSNAPNVLGRNLVGDSEDGQGWYDLAVAASPTNGDQIVVGGINVWRSNDGGTNWEVISDYEYPTDVGYTHADIHSLDYIGDELYCGSDGGLFISENDGTTWEDLSEGLQISQYYRIAVSTTDPELILTASQDNGTNLFSEGNQHNHVIGNDGMVAAINYENDDIMYGAFQYGTLFKSIDGGDNFNEFIDGITEDGAWVTPFEFHPTNPDIVFSAYENVWKNTDGTTWVQLGNIPGSSTLTSLHISASDPDVIYTASPTAIYKSENGGDSWSGISDGLPNLTITDVTTHPENSEILWVTFSGYDEGEKVYYSENGGGDWSNISNNMPNVPVNCVSYQVGSNDGIYLGTDIGVYFKNAESFSWNDYNDGLPNVIVNQIIFQYEAGKVLLATYGRGIWTNNFFDTSSLQPTADFSATPTLICEDQTVTYLNESLNVFDDIFWTFEGGTPEESNDINPVITYETTGVYATKLVVGNANGLDSLTFENYIEVIPVIGEPAPIQETFENGENLADFPWQAKSADDAPIWEVNSDVGYESDQCVWLENYNSGPLKFDYLSSATFDLSEMDTAIVSMRVAYAKRPNSNSEVLKVFTSTDCGESWTFKKNFSSNSALASAEPTDDPFIPANADEWNLLVVDNIDPDERTENFRIQFEFRSNNGNNIYIDNINVVEEIVTATSDIQLADYGLKIFPNPVNSETASLEIKVEAPMNGNIVLTDVLGRNIADLWQGNLESGAQTLELDMKGVPSGYYIIMVQSEGQNIASTPIVIE